MHTNIHLKVMFIFALSVVFAVGIGQYGKDRQSRTDSGINCVKTGGTIVNSEELTVYVNAYRVLNNTNQYLCIYL